MKKLLFVFNPNTAAAKLKNKMLELLCRFAQEGYQLGVWPTAGPGDAQKIVAQHGEEADLVVCCGGDGTLNEVVNGLMQLKNPPLLGYIPCGTTNDFATSLKLPKSNVMQAVERILKPRAIYPFDVGEFNGRMFTYVAAFGAFTDVSYSTPQKYKNVLGYFAYLLEGVQQLGHLKPCNVRIQCDDTVYEGEYLLGMVANSTSVGGFQLGKKHKVSLNDGYFEVVLVNQPHNLAQLGGLSTALLSGNFSSELLTVAKAQKLEIEAKEPMAWTLDGEFGGDDTQTCIQVHPKALSICI